MSSQLSLRNLRSNPSRALVLLAFIIQFAVLAQNIIGPAAIEILDVRNDQAPERSAVIGFGDEFAGYIAFILEKTNEDGFVLIPYRETHEVLGNEGIMQYYLIPRRITNCPLDQPFEECLLTQGGSRTSILSLNEFPPVAIDDGKYLFVPFNEDWGIFIPLAYDQQ